MSAIEDQLTKGYRNDADELRALVYAIREGVTELLRGPWMPTSHALAEALYPTEELMEHYRGGILVDEVTIDLSDPDSEY